MKSSAMKGGGGGRLVAAIVALGASLVFGAAAQAQPQYTMDCTSCHNMPPTDSATAKKDPATGAVPGSHAGHATAAQNSCVVCHTAGVLSYGTSHRNKAIELADSFGYSRKVNGFLNQTSVPPTPLGSCATAVCHSNGKGVTSATPAWGRAPFAAPADCTQCHGVAPATGSHPTTGSKHAAYFGSGVGSCAQCHTSHDLEAKPFSHATSAGKRAIEVKIAVGGTFAGNQCSNVSCHSNGQGTFVPPTWGATLNCAGCHGDATSGTLSGKHASHVNNAAILGTSYGCVTCHADTVSDNTTISSTIKHVNGVKDVPATCSTCHNNGKGTPVAVAWTDAALGCNGCHGTSNAFGAPDYLSPGPDVLLSNSHAVHATGSATCVNCHSTTTTTGLAVIAPNHANGTRDVAAGNGKTFTRVGNTCSAISCHSNGKFTPADAKWGATLDCAGCHGNTGVVLSAAHGKHLGLASGVGCVNCHNATVTSNTVLKAGGKHMDTSLDVAGTTITNIYSGTTKNCTTSCHGSATPVWNDPSTAVCGTCHNVTLTGMSYAHGAHSTGTTYGPKLADNSGSCGSCHVSNSDAVATHANGAVDLKAGYSSTTGCTGCHNQPIDWKTGAISCEKCHTGALSVIGGITAPDKTSAATTGHGKTGIAKGCVDCHDKNSAHIDGIAGSSNRLLSTLGTGDTTCNTCHNNPAVVATVTMQNMKSHQATGLGSSCADCHDAHGTVNSKMVNGTVNGTGVSFTGTSTFANVGQTGICQVCHTTTKYFTKAGVTPQAHVDSTTNCLDCHKHNPATGLAFVPNGSCDACHGYPPAPRSPVVTFGKLGNYSTARFEDYSGGGGAHVVGAHIPQGAKASDGWVNCLPCHSGGDATHLRVLPISSHVENVSVVVDPKYRFSNDAFISYTGAKLLSAKANKTGSCFNVSCHFKPSPQWSVEK